MLPKKNPNNLYDWLIHKNIYTDKWEAAKRENVNELFSGDKGNVIRSSSFETLVEIIERTDGNKTKLNQLVR